MENIVSILTVLLGIVGVALCVIVLLQSNRSAGLGAVGGSSSTDSYWSKNKSNSMEGSLEKITKVLGALFMILAIAIMLLN